MEAEVTISSFTSLSFSVTNGLRQAGFTIAPTCTVCLYLNQMIECWWGHRKDWGAKVFYSYV